MDSFSARQYQFDPGKRLRITHGENIEKSPLRQSQKGEKCHPAADTCAGMKRTAALERKIRARHDKQRDARIRFESFESAVPLCIVNATQPPALLSIWPLKNSHAGRVPTLPKSGIAVLPAERLAHPIHVRHRVDVDSHCACRRPNLRSTGKCSRGRFPLVIILRVRTANTSGLSPAYQGIS